MTDDPLGDLERELVAAARRRSRASSRAAPRSRDEALGGVLAAVFAGFALVLALGVVLVVSVH